MENYTELPQVGFIEANKLAFTKIVDFKGRIRRSEFWWATLGLSIIAILTTWVPFVGNAIALAIALAQVSLTFRRLHDTNRSGWWIGGQIIFGTLLVVLIFVIFGAAILSGDVSSINAEELAANSIGSIIALVIGYIIALIWEVVIIVFCCIDSDVEANKYGESPKYQANI